MGNEAKNSKEMVPLAQAGIPEPEIQRQFATLRDAAAFRKHDNAKDLLKYLLTESLAGRVPRPVDIAKAVFGKEYLDPGDSQVRRETGNLRALLAGYYKSSEAKPDEIVLDVPERQYVVYAPKASPATPAPQTRARGRILEPAQDAEVHQRVPVRGRIDALPADLRPWLVVETPVGDHYPQCWTSKDSPEWEKEVRIGLVRWGADEGAVYVIHLVAVGIEGDAEFFTYMKSGRDGYGPILPTDCLTLDKKRVTRRDIRA